MSPSARPSKLYLPFGSPLPVFILVERLQNNIPMITKYETPSAAPSNPNGPGGSPQDVVFKMYRE